jgi:hypothetical protein
VHVVFSGRMAFLPWLSTIVPVVLLLPGVFACPEDCQCIGQQVYCVRKSFTSIPSLDASTLELYMHTHALHTIPNRAFVSTPNLRILELENCGIQSLEPGAFAGLNNLTKLNLKGNKIQMLRQGMFAGMEQINEISLESNDLRTIDEFTFDGLKNEVTLKLENNNRLETISPKAFKGSLIKEMYLFNSSLSSESLDSILPLQGILSVFYLSFNRIPLDIPHTLFKRFFLLTLNLAGNGITDVSFLHHVRADDISLEFNKVGTLNLSEFPSLKQTRILRLSHTASTNIDGSYFTGMDNLRQLYLSDNNISTLPESLIEVFGNLESITLARNPIHCNCEILWFYKWLPQNAHVVTEPPTCQTPHVSVLASLDPDSLVCAAPASVTIKEKVEADGVVLICSANGDPAPRITWTLPDGRVQSSSQVQDLSVPQTEATYQADPHGGIYTCAASNLAGNVSREIEVSPYASSSAGVWALKTTTTMLVCMVFCFLS